MHTSVGFSLETLASPGKYLNNFIIKICQHSHRISGKIVRTTETQGICLRNDDDEDGLILFQTFILNVVIAPFNVNNFDNGIKWTCSVNAR